MAWDNAVVTNNGVAMLQQVLAGEVLTLDWAAGGTGTVPPSSLMAQTALKEQKQNFAITGAANVPNGKKISVQITNVGLMAGYLLQQVGIWAHVGNSPPVLFAILQDNTGIAIPSDSEVPDFAMNFYAVIDFSNESNFNLIVDPSALVTLGELNEKLANLETKEGAQAKANTAEANAKAYTDAHEQKAAPHSGHETPSGAQTKANAAEANAKGYTDTHAGTKNTHGVGSGYYIAKTSRSDQLPAWNDVQGKPSNFTPSAHKSTHASSGSDALTPSDIGAETPAGAQAKAEAAAGAVQVQLDAHVSEIATQDKAGHIRLSDIPLPTIATQAEAEAGTNNTKFMTPLRTHQAIDSKVRIVDNNMLELNVDGELKTFLLTYVAFIDNTNAPGPKYAIAGSWDAGFFGEVSASELISGDALASLVGISQGISQHSTAGWLKFAWQGKILFVAKKTFRYSISWDHINSANAVYGDKTVKIGGLTYKVRLLKGASQDPTGAHGGAICHGSEWNRLMLPIHQEAINKNWVDPNSVESDIPVWSHNLGAGNQGMYTDEDILTHYDYGSGSRSWCQEVAEKATFRISRGYYGVSFSNSSTSSSTDAYYGWRPCLELVP